MRLRDSGAGMMTEGHAAERTPPTHGEGAEGEAWERERARLRFLTSAGDILESSLDYETTLKELGQLVVPGLADWYAVDLVDENGQVTNVSVAHVDPAKVELAKRLRERHPPDPEDRSGVVEVARSARSEWVPEISDEMLEKAAEDADLLEILRELGLRSAIIVPLWARGRSLGAMTMITAESGRRYDEQDLRLAEELGKRAGIAIDNAGLFAAEHAARARAEGVEARLLAVAEASRALATSLDLSMTLQRAADLAASHLADSAAVYLNDEHGVLHGRAFATRIPEWRDAIARFQDVYETATNLASHVLRAYATGKTQVEEEIDTKELVNQLGMEAGELLGTLDVRSAMSVPLIMSGRTVGVLALAWRELQLREQLDAAFAEELARRMARAIENARLFDAERRANERVSLVSRVTSVLSDSLEYETGLRRLAELVTEEFADFCLLDVIEENGSVRRLVVIHRDPAKQHLVEGLGRRPPALDGNVPAAIAMRTRSIVHQEVREDVLASFAADAEHLDMMRQIGGLNFIAVPLIARDRVLGALTLSSTSRRYHEEDLSLATEIAGRAALHLDNTRLFTAQTRAARQAARLQSIVDAVFASDSLDELLQELLQRIVRAMDTDLAAILLMDEAEPVLRMRAAVGLEEDVRAAVRVPLGEGFAGRIAENRRPQVVESLESVDEISAYLRERVRSIVGVPLMVDREVVGVLHTGSVASRAFDNDDVALLQLAAERAAVAIRRNQLFERQREIATLLQTALLPSELPTIPGVKISALFVAAGEGVEVGGDFYDVFRVDGRTWGLVVGDVCGRGPQAAALTGLARNGLRAIALRESRPADVLTGLNDIMVRSQVDRFCTVIYGTAQSSPGCFRVAIARGGHPPPYVLRGDGSVEVIQSAGPLLGVFENPEFDGFELDLAPGDALVLFTDGLVERNATLQRLGGLTRVLAGCAGLDAAAITARLGETLGGPTNSSPDDVVVLVVRVESRNGRRSA
jgi:GAF domain-containing protein